MLGVALKKSQKPSDSIHICWPVAGLKSTSLPGCWHRSPQGLYPCCCCYSDFLVHAGLSDGRWRPVIVPSSRCCLSLEYVVLCYRPSICLLAEPSLFLEFCLWFYSLFDTLVPDLASCVLSRLAWGLLVNYKHLLTAAWHWKSWRRCVFFILSGFWQHSPVGPSDLWTSLQLLVAVAYTCVGIFWLFSSRLEKELV